MHLSDRYKILQELGDQKIRKFGRVFLIENKETGEPCVLKHASFEHLDPNVAERIRNEHRFSFSQEGLPCIRESILTDEESFLVLNYKQGQTLDVYWAKLRKKERIGKLKEVLSGLSVIMEHLRLQGIVHCDIKPSNILVHEERDELQVNLIDFGMAFDTRNDPGNRHILFPLGFAAPELILNQLELIDHTTDLFAIGIMIWRLFTGKLPLSHPNPSIFTNLQITHPIPENDDIPKELFRILSKMCFKHQFSTSPNRMHQDEVKQLLAEAKKQRYQSLPEVLNELNQLNDKANWISKVLFGNRARN